ncbi:MAG: transporter substrate-binding domain-containing protein [Clostridiales bacterium]|nr:transporter substrate-binding domain-containing protein [Clostridiales bacterium]
MKKLLVVMLTMVLSLASVFAMTACNKPEDGEDVLKVVQINLSEEEYAFAVNKGNTTLLNSVNAYLATIQENGQFAEIVDKYFGDGTPTGYSIGNYDSTKDQLVVLTNTPFEPFEYVGDDGKYYGVDMEIAAGVAQYIDKELCIIEWTDFNTICEQANNYANAIVAAGLTVSSDRAEVIDFSNSYYQASQVIVAKAGDTTFDECETAADVEAILATFDASKKVGYQNGTTGELYVNGDEDWGFAGINCTPQGYKTAALAAQALINGSIDFVVVDVAPATAIVKAMNEANK